MLTPNRLLEEAKAIAAALREVQDETDARGYYADAIHDRLLRGGFYRILHRSIRRQHNDDGGGSKLTHVLEGIEAADAGHLQIEQHKLREFVLEFLQQHLAGFIAGGEMSLPDQPLDDGRANNLFVVDHKNDRMHGSHPFQCGFLFQR